MSRHFSFEDFIDRQLCIANNVKGWSQEFLEKKYLIVGVGGNGTHVALALVCMGVREICLIDKDVVDPSNVSRQVLYTHHDVGRKKVDVAIEALDRRTFHTKISGHSLDVISERRKFADLVKDSDFVFTLVDAYSTAFFAASQCYNQGKPMIFGGTDPYSGHGSHITLQEPKGKPCWNCLQGTGNRAPKEWVEYYSSLEVNEAEFDMNKIQDYNNSIRMPRRSASIYYTASVGSNLMVLNMANWFRGVGYYNRIITNLLTLEIWKWRVDPRLDCVLCGTHATT